MKSAGYGRESSCEAVAVMRGTMWLLAGCVFIQINGKFNEMEPAAAGLNAPSALFLWNLVLLQTHQLIWRRQQSQPFRGLLGHVIDHGFEVAFSFVKNLELAVCAGTGLHDFADAFDRPAAVELIDDRINER